MYLRPVISSDLNDLFKIYGDPATNTFNPAGPYPNIDHAKMVMNRWLDHWQTHSFGNWAISLLTNPEKIIGFGGLGIRNYMEALHDVVKAGKARYIGASSMEAWRFAKMQHTAERNGWTRFITMQPQYNLLYREEEREMLPLCEDQGVGVIPWSPMARGRLTRDWSVTSRRTQNDAFALKMYENAALLDKPVIDVVASIAEKHSVPRAHVAIAWLLSKSVITAPIIGATKPEHLSTAISALDFSLSDAEITELEVRYLPHPVDGIIPPLPDTPPSLTPPSAIQNY
ncbi:aldo/keto reductase [Klebsiella pneumoniae]|uniref:aldo/keto reductase n=1 Tax=Klebsiella pneumoniae TaxID=573 RepID=UPI0009031481|nr:aldo/keto reductase [Klebsiella pneumoniae]HBY9197369.1 GNAT family N-acetyltransferase [Klebsiella pneumoniae CHS 01]HBY9215050.1 GNAT family N-acetyltransferase [Klebsiella pneumoniae CHS 04]EIV9677757.1 GNAT family N-acetyltransferase [Klebsiella pneumoniae]EIV9883634.1 GNAT family N-acetyltransferase [Klebsiella pneumoniae]EIW0113805.1 GNAT family N-acetyltransferase [Klebsiella pneumoniae]